MTSVRAMICGAAALMGFAIGGFFDGTLLHQILQWHHLSSGVDDWNQNIWLLIATDCAFHLAMFAALLASLWMMWRSGIERSGLASSALKQVRMAEKQRGRY